MAAEKKIFYYELWGVVRPFWRSKEGWAAGAMLLCALALIVFRLYVSVLFNEWQKLFFNAIQLMNAAECTHQLFRFVGLSLLFLPLTGYQRYLRGLAQIRWRSWLSERYTGKLLDERNYYRLQHVADGTDNPDQRIAEDLQIFSVETINIVFGFIEAMGSLFAFSAILWNSPGSPEVGGMKIPGFLFWLTFFYSLTGSWFNHLMGKDLSAFNCEQQKFEADYRFSLVRLRENAEAIAAYGGEEREKAVFASHFTSVIRMWRNILRRNRTLDWFFSGYNQLSFILPYLVMTPRFFSGAILLGDIQQSASAFSQTRMAFSWFIYNYGALAKWKATVDRLIGFEKAMAKSEALQQTKLIRETGPAMEGLRIIGLDTWLPDGRPLLRQITLDIPSGSRILITGPSGCGKTTFFHTINGLWPFCGGKIILPTKERVLFIPQKPYLPIDTLRQVLTYPDRADCCDTAMMIHVLVDCGLSQLCDQLDEERHWAQQLSPGEQQRLAFARVLLIRPQWLFLDEATSALDEASEERLYRLLIGKLPETAIVSIAHRTSLRRFHERRLDFDQMNRDVSVRCAER
ncbi:MAG: putative transporter [Firmicutes bacterium]|nr:putative transporter [Bacillota bacterium]